MSATTEFVAFAMASMKLCYARSLRICFFPTLNIILKYLQCYTFKAYFKEPLQH